VVLVYRGRGRPNKYCDVCGKIYRKIYLKLYHRMHRKKYHSNLGTSDFSPHFCGDYVREYYEVKAEKKRIGI
jgi:hypothetical protein